MTKQRLVLVVLGALFFVTGADALFVEQTAEKLLSTIVGASTPAGALVLAVYFGGLALGGVLSTSLARKLKNPVALYATLEGVVGAFALVLSSTFPLAQTGLAHLVALGGDHALAVFTLRLIAASLWLLAPTIAMGASYPAVVGALAWLGVERVPLAMTRLYALNLFGAVASAVAGPYFVLPALGMTGTLRAVAITQAVVVACAWLLARTFANARAVDAPPTSPKRAKVRTLLIVCAFLSGAVVFALEVLWVQLIGAVVGMSVYAFAQMLAVVLLGLWLGSTLVGVVASRRTTALPPFTVALAFIAAGAVCALAGHFWDHAPLWLLAAGPHVDGFADGERARFLAVVRLLLPPACALGVVYPSLFRSGFFEARDASAVAGVLGAVNALGSIAGSLAAGFVLIPRFGTEVSYRALCLVLVVTGVALLLVLRRHAQKRGEPSRALTASTVAGLVALAIVSAMPKWDALLLTSGLHVYFSIGQVHPDDTIAFWAEDAAGGITTVVETKDKPPIRTLLTNGKFQGNDSGEMADQIALSLVPCALTSARDRAFVVGLGTGQSAEVIAAAGFRSIEIAEISEGIARAAREQFAHVNRGLLDDPRVVLTIDDGRNHLLRSDRRYDVIAMELSSIWFAGAASLYTREYYELAAQHLAPHGVLQQWIQFHHIAPDEIISAIATMRSVFPSVTLWRLQNQGVLVGSNDPIALSPAVLADLKASPALAHDLRVLHDVAGVDVSDLGAHVVLDAAAVDRVAAAAHDHGIPLNTDDNRWLEMRTPRHNLERIDHARIVLDTLQRFAAAP